MKSFLTKIACGFLCLMLEISPSFGQSATYVAPSTVDLIKALTKSINVANGLAGLDSTGAVTAPVSGAVDSATVLNSPLNAYLFQTQSVGPSIFIGGISNTKDLADAASVKDLVATKKIGFYIMPLGTQAIWGQTLYNKAEALWKPLGKFMGEFGFFPANSRTELTITNTTSSAISLKSLSTYFTDSESRKWYYTATGTNSPITGSATCSSFSGGYNTVDSLPAKGSCTISVTLDQNGANTLSATDTFTSNTSGITVSSFLPITSSGTGTSYGELGNSDDGTTNGNWIFTTGAYLWATATGQNVSMATVNIDDGRAHTPTEVALWKRYVDALRTHGVSVVAPYLRAGTAYVSGDNSAALKYTLGDIGPVFGGTDAEAGVRDMIIYGGGVAIDWPPVSTSQYGDFTNFYNASICKWALDNNLECIVTLAPPAPGDTRYLQYIETVATVLKNYNAVPTRWVVENYEINSDFTEACNAVGTADDTTKADKTMTCTDGSTKTYTYAESLNSAALYLSKYVGTSSPPDSNKYLTSNGTDILGSLTGIGNRGTGTSQLSSNDLSDGATLLHGGSVGIGPGYAIPRLGGTGEVLAWGYNALGWGYRVRTNGYGYCLSSNTCLSDYQSTGTGLSIIDSAGTIDFGIINGVVEADLPLRITKSVADTYIFQQGSWIHWNSSSNIGIGGETIISNSRGLGTGGFIFTDCPLGSTWATCRDNNRVMTITAQGTVDVPISVSVPVIKTVTIETSLSTQTLSAITAATHSEGDRVWCHDCRATGQATGAGTGRWIYKDSSGTWRTDDSVAASN